ncbi:MAG: head GIN domain-containing protein [Bacteroidales bacterium]|jgi:hypothetical protein|nr:head GIN domain-containing protein [Bacteroidales bacterium]
MKTKKFSVLLLLFAAGLFFTGCYKPWHVIEGNHDVQTDTRAISGFSHVFNEGNFDVYIIQDASGEVIIEAESNLIPLIRTRIEGSALVIDTKDNLHNNYPMKVYVHTPEIEKIRLSGSGLMHAENINTGDIDIDLSGSGDIFFSGIADDLECKISGSGDMEIGIECNTIDAKISGSGEMEFYGSAHRGDLNISGSGSFRAYDLTLQDCYARISGSGDMYLTVEDYLNVTISGSGDVYYLGNPIIETNISGSGNVIHPR